MLCKESRRAFLGLLTVWKEQPNPHLESVDFLEAMAKHIGQTQAQEDDIAPHPPCVAGPPQ